MKMSDVGWVAEMMSAEWWKICNPRFVLLLGGRSRAPPRCLGTVREGGEIWGSEVPPNFHQYRAMSMSASGSI
jgi:hypothetical protein|tara:strand:+ start:15435 stop:15653 length:219 start_codon:yes stop_codon:yes gene_type:complete